MPTPKKYENAKARNRANYLARREEFVLRSRSRRESLKTHIKACKLWIWEYKLSHPCIKCGEKDPRVLDCHHQNPLMKEYVISQMIVQGYPLEAIKRELAKCEILCANCHRREHYD